MSTVEAVVKVGCFMAVVWAGGRLFKPIHAQLVGEIIAGIVLSKHVINWLPPEAFVLTLGQVGLILLVLEGGMSIQVHLLPSIGVRACLIAVVGTVLPVLLGWGFMTALGKGTIEAVAAGAALSSTSIGMASKMLQSMGQLNTQLGNFVAVAAVVDDVLSLVILAVIQRLSNAKDSSDAANNGGVVPNATSTTPMTVSTTALATSSAGDLGGEDDSGSDEGVWLYLEPVVVSCAFIILGIILIQVVPKVEHRIPWRSEEQRKQALLVTLLLTSIGLVVAADYTGTAYLFGAFTAGMAFANVPGMLTYWLELRSISDLFASVFFASIGLVIPVTTLFKPVPLGYGFLYSLPGIVGKFVTGVFAGSFSTGIVVGWAMVGRGELGFLISQEALEDGLVDEETFIISVWALLICTLLSPILMRYSLSRSAEQFNAYRVENELDETEQSANGHAGSGEGGLGSAKQVFDITQLQNVPDLIMADADGYEEDGPEAKAANAARAAAMQGEHSSSSGSNGSSSSVASGSKNSSARGGDSQRTRRGVALESTTGDGDRGSTRAAASASPSTITTTTVTGQQRGVGSTNGGPHTPIASGSVVAVNEDGQGKHSNGGSTQSGGGAGGGEGDGDGSDGGVHDERIPQEAMVELLQQVDDVFAIRTGARKGVGTAQGATNTSKGTAGGDGGNAGDNKSTESTGATHEEAPSDADYNVVGSLAGKEVLI